MSYSARLLSPGQNPRDVLGEGEGLQPLRTEGPGIVLLLDPWPHANWEHPCWIATVEVEREGERLVQHNLPPGDEEGGPLVRFASYRPDGSVTFFRSGEPAGAR